MKILKRVLAVVAAALPALSHAGYLPYGVQSNLTPETLNNWGWTQCLSSTSGLGPVTQKISSNCAGDYLMMGLFDSKTNKYVILGAGEYDVVMTWTNTPMSQSTSNVQALDNWSNGLNFYRSTYWGPSNNVMGGTWGFTTNSVVNLVVTRDTFLTNGYSKGENTSSQPSAGLSFSGSFNYDTLSHYTTYNTNGYDYGYSTSTFTKVFLSLSGPVTNVPPGTDPGPGDGENPGTTPVPEPSSLALFGLGIGGMGLASRRRRQMA